MLGRIVLTLSVSLLAAARPATAMDLTGSPPVRELSARVRQSAPPMLAPPAGWTVTVAGDVVYLQDDGSHGCSAPLVYGDFTWFDTCVFAADGALAAFYDSFPSSDPDTVVLNIAWDAEFPAWFYLPLANDVRGIGLQHLGPETFGDPSGLRGFIFMNTPSALGVPGSTDHQKAFDSVWSQEFAHRWGAFVHYLDPETGEEREDDLDDYRAHWRYPFDSDGSVMGGMNWLANGDGSFTTDASLWQVAAFSSLDLYLMGLVPAGAVDDFFLIREPVPDYGQWGPLPASPGPVTISGRQVRLRIDDVIAAEGPRDPDWRSAPRAFHAPHLVILRAEDGLPDATLQAAFESQRGRAAETFERLTHGLAHLDTGIAASATGAPPSASIAPVTGAREGERVVLDASGSADPEQGTLSFVWDFGDGSGAFTEEPRIEHVFRRAGTHEVTVLAVDDRGNTATASAAVHVAEQPASGCACSLGPAGPRAPGWAPSLALAAGMVALAGRRRRNVRD